MEEKKEDSIYIELSKINVNDKVEKKNGLVYLSWAWAWDRVLKKYPDANYEVLRFENNLPYVHDIDTGYMVFTKVTINEETKEMFLPVMDGANKAMKREPYKYKVKDWYESKKQNKDVFKDKTVESATMFDINKTIMRCLVKNLAMFGLGMYIYAGEDLPTTKEPKKVTDIDYNNNKESFDNYYKKIGKEEFYKIYNVSDKVKELLDG